MTAADDLIVADMESYAKRAYVEGDIDIAEFEACLVHIHAGGLGCPRFPFLPAFAPLPTEVIRE